VNPKRASDHRILFNNEPRVGGVNKSGDKTLPDEVRNKGSV